MAGGPITAMIMHPVVKEELLREAHLQRLERTCRLVDQMPFRNFDGLGDEAPRIQVLITSWGCPRIDRSVVSTLPGLKLIAVDVIYVDVPDVAPGGSLGDVILDGVDDVNGHRTSPSW